MLGLDPTGQPSRLRLHIPQTSDELNPGDQVRLKAMLYPVPPQILPGGRDFQRELYFAGIGAVSQRLSFGPSSGLPANVQEKLTASAAKFLKYFEGLGYHPKTEINFNTKPEIEHAVSYYDYNTQTIYVDARCVGDESLLFHEYSHLILYSSLPFNALSGPTKWKFSQVPIEYGLANYFTASARNRPLIGELAAQVLKTGTPSLSNLENGEKVTTLKPTDFAVATKLEDGWGGAFWDIRNKLGQPAADQLIY